MLTKFALNASKDAIQIAARATQAVCFAFAMTVAAAFPVGSQEISSSSIELKVDVKERLIISPGMVWTIDVDRPFGELVIGDIEVVDVFPLSSTSFYAQTRKSGITNLVFYNDNNEFIGEIEFVVSRENDEAKLTSLINRVVPGASISVEVFESRLFVFGEVKEKDDVGVVLDIAQSYQGLSEPLLFKISYPEYTVSDTTISVFRGGDVTPYNIRKSQVQASDQWITEYGPIEARLDSEDERDSGTPSVVINNISGQNSSTTD